MAKKRESKRSDLAKAPKETRRKLDPEPGSPLMSADFTIHGRKGGPEGEHEDLYRRVLSISEKTGLVLRGHMDGRAFIKVFEDFLARGGSTTGFATYFWEKYPDNACWPLVVPMPDGRRIIVPAHEMRNCMLPRDPAMVADITATLEAKYDLRLRDGGNPMWLQRIVLQLADNRRKEQWDRPIREVILQQHGDMVESVIVKRDTDGDTGHKGRDAIDRAIMAAYSNPENTTWAQVTEQVNGVLKQIGILAMSVSAVSKRWRTMNKGRECRFLRGRPKDSNKG